MRVRVRVWEMKSDRRKKVFISRFFFIYFFFINIIYVYGSSSLRGSMLQRRRFSLAVRFAMKMMVITVTSVMK